MRLYTRTGDQGETGLFFGGRAAKDGEIVEALGAVDEAQAALGVARAAEPTVATSEILTEAERHLWILMAEVATAPVNRHKLVAAQSLVTGQMVLRLEEHIDCVSDRVEMPKGFVIPGTSRPAAALDFARAVVRRAERRVFALEMAREEHGSFAPIYLNRLSDLCWILARWEEGPEHQMADPSDSGLPRRGPKGAKNVAAPKGEPAKLHKETK